MADYDFGDLASPAKPAQAAQKFDFGTLASAAPPAGTSSIDQIPRDIPSPIGGRPSPAVPQPARPQTPQQSGGFLGALQGLGEAGLALGTGLAAAPIGSARGVFDTLTGGKAGTQAGIQEGEKKGSALAEKLTYSPRSEQGKDYTSALGDFFKSAGVEALPGLAGELSALGQAGQLAKPALAARAGQIASKGSAVISKAEQAAQKIADMVPKKSSLAGVGAAKTEESLLRSQRAADLPVPIKLTKGQAERTFEQQKFERETAKTKEGEPLRQRYAEQNEQMLQNFDSFIDQTGAQQPSLRQVGAVVDKALINKVKAAKSKINDAYTAAREAGELEQKVNLSSLGQYVDKNRGAAKNANILSLVESEIQKKSKPASVRQSSVMGEPAIKPNPFERTISLNDLEEIRKTIGKNSTEGTPNAVYGQEMKKLIDQITEGKGGSQYKEARRLYENYSKEFKDKAAISKLMRFKPGTKDRAVAMEDVFDHSIMKGSLDDVRAVRRTLQTAGEEGQQAWRELQGQTIKNIKDTITSNSARDVKGNPIVSPDKLNRIVSELDKDGKLDFVFGKKGAAQIRDINDLAKDVYTAPPGSVNTSNTATALLAILDSTASIMTGLPLPLASAGGYAIKKIKSNRLSKQVSQALDTGT